MKQFDLLVFFLVLTCVVLMKGIVDQNDKIINRKTFNFKDKYYRCEEFRPQIERRK